MAEVASGIRIFPKLQILKTAGRFICFFWYQWWKIQVLKHPFYVVCLQRICKSQFSNCWYFVGFYCKFTSRFLRKCFWNLSEKQGLQKNVWLVHRTPPKSKLAILAYTVDKFTSRKSKKGGFQRGPWEAPWTPKCLPGTPWGPEGRLGGPRGVLGGSRNEKIL